MDIKFESHYEANRQKYRRQQMVFQTSLFIRRQCTPPFPYKNKLTLYTIPELGQNLNGHFYEQNATF
jgi:hypothetical protein